MPWFSLMNVMRLGSWEILEGETSFEYCCQIDIAQQFFFLTEELKISTTSKEK
jgi:hypothetical protein